MLRNRKGRSVKIETGKKEKPIHDDFCYLIITVGNQSSVLHRTL